MRRRLYLHVYLTVVGSLVIFALVAGALWRTVTEVSPAREAFALLSELAQAALADASAPPAAQQAALESLRARVRAHMALYAADGTRIARVGRSLPAPEPGRESGGWMRMPDGRHAWAIPLADGRWLVAAVPPGRPDPMLGVFLVLGLIVLGVAVGVYPVVRGLTRRMERLQASVESLGAGNLGARVKVEGSDEVSALAVSFNRAAERIEQLVGAHKRLLANASHELRSPLARIRMGIDMLKEGADPALRQELSRSIAELDALIDEILLASRLDASRQPDSIEDVDLLALLAEECARADASLEGEALTVQGDQRLLRRMARNLLENAKRHAAGSAIEVRLTDGGGRAAIEICDRGPGVPRAERERIFEPFYRPVGSRESEGGVGLGLALVRQIVQKHGGSAACMERPGGGSCFRVELPRPALQ